MHNYYCMSCSDRGTTLSNSICPKCNGSPKEKWDSITSTELFESMNELAENSDLRKRVEDGINDNLPEGYSFSIDGSGIGRLGCPLHVSKLNKG